MLVNIRNFLVRWKFRIGYFSGFLTTFAAIVILSSTIQDKLNLLNINLNYFIVVIIVGICVLLGAYLLDRFGFISSETDYANTKNNLLNEIGGKNGRNN